MHTKWVHMCAHPLMPTSVCRHPTQRTRLELMRTHAHEPEKTHRHTNHIPQSHSQAQQRAADTACESSCQSENPQRAGLSPRSVRSGRSDTSQHKWHWRFPQLGGRRSAEHPARRGQHKHHEQHLERMRPDAKFISNACRNSNWRSGVWSMKSTGNPSKWIIKGGSISVERAPAGPA